MVTWRASGISARWIQHARNRCQAAHHGATDKYVLWTDIR